jgi:hypothetical protein
VGATRSGRIADQAANSDQGCGAEQPSEFKRHGLKSRFGEHRADLKHQWLDAIIVADPWVAAGWLAFSGARKLLRPARS